MQPAVTENVNIPSTPKSQVPASVPFRIAGRDIVCFSHDWTGDPLSKTHIMRLLSKRNRILWVNSIGYRAPHANIRDLRRVWKKLSAFAQPIREVEPNLFVLNPLAIPAYGLAIAQAISRRWLCWQVRRAMSRLGFRRAICWAFNPASALVAGDLGEETVIYHCVDEYSALQGVAQDSIRRFEEQLLRRADAVIVSADTLFDAKRPMARRIALVRHGVDYPHFRSACDASTAIPAELAALPRPRIGYFGLISKDWVDFELIHRIAAAFPNASVVMLGKCDCDPNLLRGRNIHLLGRKPYADLPAYCKGFDAAVIPFPVTELTRHANPLKAREYLAAGLPVVSTDVPEVRVLSDCRVAMTHDEFVDQLKVALSHGPSESIGGTMRVESWDARLAEIEEFLAPVLNGPR